MRSGKYGNCTKPAFEEIDENSALEIIVPGQVQIREPREDSCVPIGVRGLLPLQLKYWALHLQGLKRTRV